MTESSEYLRSKYRREIKNWLYDALAEDVESSDDFETRSNQVHLQAMRAYDPSASLLEELTLRVASDALRDGGLALTPGSGLLRPIQETVAELGGRAVTELELVGVSPGSTVLHFRPVHDRVPQDDRAADTTALAANTDSSESEAALREFVALLAAAEAEEDLQRWASAVEPLDKLSAALDALEARVEATWTGVSGQVRSSTMTQRGRDFVHSLMHTVARSEPATISGRVVELRENGYVKVKSGSSKRSPAYSVRVPPEELLNMKLSLGETVHLAVRRETQIDELGQAKGVEHYLIGRLTGPPDQEPISLPD